MELIVKERQVSFVTCLENVLNNKSNLELSSFQYLTKELNTTKVLIIKDQHVC